LRWQNLVAQELANGVENPTRNHTPSALCLIVHKDVSKRQKRSKNYFFFGYLNLIFEVGVIFFLIFNF
jgi:hypothetical protein